MKRIFLSIMIVLTASSLFAQKKAKKEADLNTAKWRYEIQCAGIGLDGTYLIKVWSFSKNPDVAIEQAKKNAVHGIIFKGIVGVSNPNVRCTTQQPLASNPNLEEEKKDFFDMFFANGGKYMKYVNITSDGNISASDRIKVDKEYKIGVIVSVMKDELRKDLEAAGIIKGLSSGF